MPKMAIKMGRALLKYSEGSQFSKPGGRASVSRLAGLANHSSVSLGSLVTLAASASCPQLPTSSSASTKATADPHPVVCGGTACGAGTMLKATRGLLSEDVGLLVSILPFTMSSSVASVSSTSSTVYLPSNSSSTFWHTNSYTLVRSSLRLPLMSRPERSRSVMGCVSVTQNVCGPKAASFSRLMSSLLMASGGLLIFCSRPSNSCFSCA
mmetsp:Transcript_20928/g.58252  ORF Transcript_20928/g.58252 Transcript_20928/m.58252 type:complete len:210 (+) Transcript_20928:1016-1645(+)